MFVYPGFEVAPGKNSHGVKSDERGGHLMSPRKETTWHAQETFLWEFRANNENLLVETTHFLLHVRRPIRLEKVL
jgi:hypothetical protein